MNRYSCNSAFFTITLKQKLLSRKVLLLGVLLFFLFTTYLDPIKYFSSIAQSYISPWVFPFVMSDPYFLIIFMSGIIYFYSDDGPSLNSFNLYYIIRMGKVKWGIQHIKYILFSAWVLTVASFLICCLAIVPRLHWETVWGKVLFTMAKTDAGNMSGLFWEISPQFISNYSVIEGMLLSFVIISCGIAFIGVFTFYCGLYSKGNFSAFLSSILIVFTIISAYVSDSLKKQIAYISPISWMRITQINRSRFGYELMPNISYIIIVYILLIISISWLSVFKVNNSEY